ncbi:MAG: TrmJ/YjtD family RNA methyltransferase [Phycisphaerales bacterium]|nr:MAG: TrmJ/YjtD family RNA methyltransferase [Phycisphaerales bacterium]
MDDPLGNIRIVLVRPKFAGNIGAAARAMANTGLHRLVLVAPQCDPLSAEARKAGARAEPVLRSARIVRTLTDGLDGVVYAVGTSCRGGLYRRQMQVSPERLAEQAVSRAWHGVVAILFGSEDNGLANDELLTCDAVFRIPSCDAYPSLNLAQAVMITGYELFRAARRAQTRSEPAPPPPAPQADAATISRLMGKYRRALLKIGYLHSENPEHLLFPLRAVLSRAGMTVKEARILMGMAQQIEDFADRADRPDATDR